MSFSKWNGITPLNGFDYDRDYEQIAERFERIRALAVAAGSMSTDSGNALVRRTTSENAYSRK